MQCIENKNSHLHFCKDSPADGRVLLFSKSLGADLRVSDVRLPDGFETAFLQP